MPKQVEQDITNCYKEKSPPADARRDFVILYLSPPPVGEGFRVRASVRLHRAHLAPAEPFAERNHLRAQAYCNHKPNGEPQVKHPASYRARAPLA